MAVTRKDGIKAFFTRCWRTNAPLTAFSIATVAFTLMTMVGIAVDARTILGQPAWLKPLKFGISISVYTFTIVWILGLIRASRPWIKKMLTIFPWIVIGVFVAEIVPITTQVIRGTTSHFNVATPFDAALLGVMATSITVLWAANFLLAVILIYQRFEKPAFGWSMRLGLIITLIGMALGYLMTTPTPEQVASWQQGAPVTVVGAHSVGVSDGGPGMPVTGWSTEGGDLRVAHFVGLHALQVLPFIGWWISRKRRLSHRQQMTLVWIASLSYLGLVAVVTIQALRGQPLVAPDALTLGLFAGLIALTTAAVVWTLSPARRNVNPCGAPAS